MISRIFSIGNDGYQSKLMYLQIIKTLFIEMVKLLQKKFLNLKGSWLTENQNLFGKDIYLVYNGVKQTLDTRFNGVILLHLRFKL